jgi:2-polyprenyl-6-methoxyphenol hydroxylase-like FAD-dependent oxidoreductase
MAQSTSREIDILIIGAGPVGLAAAIELGIRGVRVLLIEQNDRTGVAPRAKTTNVRTRTHLRRWGIADRLAEESPFGVDYPNNMVFVTRLSSEGHELARFANAFNASPERSELYPEHAQWIPQYKLEKVLLEKVRTLPSVEILFGARFISATQDHTSVHSLIEVNGKNVTVNSRYLIGADGGRSTVREQIGAKMEGRSALMRAYNIIFRAPGLGNAHRFGPAAIYWQFGRHGASVLGPMDRDDIWFIMHGLPRDQTLTHEEAAALIRERTGVDLPYEILSADAWFANELLADRYLDRRIILAGDACHLHPPAGGYGMNLGIGDAVDLGWKLAATLQGWGGANLVASYEAERRPIHRTVIDEAVANLVDTVPSLPPEIEDLTPAGEETRKALGTMLQSKKGREFHTLGTVLGLGYEASPITFKEPGPAPQHNNEIYTPTARPGYLAPHAWLADGRSLYDCFGLGFTLVVAEDAEAGAVDQAGADAKNLGVPLEIVRPNFEVAKHFGAKLTLIRPDQHVAWRGDRWGNVFPRVLGAAEDNTV